MEKVFLQSNHQIHLSWCALFCSLWLKNRTQKCCAQSAFLSLEKPLLNTWEARMQQQSVQKTNKQGFFFCQYLAHDFLLLLHSTNSQHNLQVPTCLENTQPLISPPHGPRPSSSPSTRFCFLDQHVSSFDNVLGRFFDVMKKPWRFRFQKNKY